MLACTFFQFQKLLTKATTIMAKRFHSSLEAAQHGKKDLLGLTTFAREINCTGLQPSNFHLQGKDGSFRSAKSITAYFEGDNPLRLDGVSGHCPFWVLGTAWTGSKTIRPFIPAEVAPLSPEKIEEWAEDYCLKLLDLCAELDVKVLPMFWGVNFGWELATGYPWGFFAGADYDLLEEGKERFVKNTQKVRDHARDLGISLAHEIHPGTAAMCADDFLMLVDICDDDPCLGVNADPSHCWEGESWQTRFTKVGPFITGCHVKDHLVRPGLPLRSMESNWKNRAMQFTKFGEGDIDLIAYSQLMDDVGYTARYCEAHSCDTAPLVGEGESAYVALDDVSGHGTKFIEENLCVNYAETSFEDGMGEDEK